MTELQLYKFIKDNDIEYRWESEEILFWVPFYLLGDLTDLIGSSYLSEGGIQVRLQEGYIAMAGYDMCEYFGINPDNVFKK